MATRLDELQKIIKLQDDKMALQAANEALIAEIELLPKPDEYTLETCIMGPGELAAHMYEGLSMSYAQLKGHLSAANTRIAILEKRELDFNKLNRRVESLENQRTLLMRKLGQAEAREIKYKRTQEYLEAQLHVFKKKQP